jgi:hypothetical protein
MTMARSIGLRLAAVASLAMLAATDTVALATAERGDNFRPIEAITYDVGSKRVIGYFSSASGKCRVTLMIAEAFDPDISAPTSAARISLSLRPGERTALETAENASLALTCGTAAQTVQVTRPAAVRM